MKILKRSDKDKITLKAIEKHRYGVRKTVSKHLFSELGYIYIIIQIFNFSR